MFALAGQAIAASEGLHRYDDQTVCFDQDWQYTFVPGETRIGRYSEKASAKVEIDFLWTAVELVHRAGFNQFGFVISPDSDQPFGLACVEMDGRPVSVMPGAVKIDADGRAVIDTSLKGRTLLARGLTPGRHRLTLTNLGQPSKPGGTTKVVVIGFNVMAEIPGNESQQQAWRSADAVCGGEGWRQRAAELASTVKNSGDLSSLDELLKASLTDGTSSSGW